MRMIIQVFLDESSGLLGELEQALASGDAGRVRAAAHSLKGALGIFGVPAVVETACRLETFGQAGELTGAREAYCRLEEEIQNMNLELGALC
jgi:two-component system sensor histidine kinase/response regulator